MIAWATEADLTEYEKIRLKCSRAFQLAMTDVDDAGKIEMIISIPVRNCFTNKYMGRENIDYYPRDFCMKRGEVPGAHNALDYAKMYLEEAKNYHDSSMTRVRQECLRAAELLCIHASTEMNWQGGAEAWCVLGDVYQQFKDDSQMWPQSTCDVKASYPDIMKVTSIDERAILCYENAQKMGSIEALYKLFDFLTTGKGCKADEARAHRLLKKAWRKKDVLTHLSIANVALRLGFANERAIGCDRNLKKALSYFQKAIISFEIASNDSDEAINLLSKAKAGVKRVQQEITLGKSR